MTLFAFTDLRLTPHYPTKSPLDDILLKVVPGADEYVTEKYAFEIMQLLGEWSRALKTAPPALASLAKFLDASIAATSLLPTREVVARVREMALRFYAERFPEDVALGPRAISSAKLKIIFPRWREWRRLNSKLSGSRKSQGSVQRVRHQHSL